MKLFLTILTTLWWVGALLLALLFAYLVISVFA
jgi:hypothetical protein